MDISTNRHLDFSTYGHIDISTGRLFDRSTSRHLDQSSKAFASNNETRSAASRLCSNALRVALAIFAMMELL